MDDRPEFDLEQVRMFVEAAEKGDLTAMELLNSWWESEPAKVRARFAWGVHTPPGTEETP